jgi:ATP-dependent Lon protease
MDSGNLVVFYLYKKVLFPHCNIILKSRSEILEKYKIGDRLIVFPARNFLDYFCIENKLAVIAEVLEKKQIDGIYNVQFKGISRVRVLKWNAYYTVILRMLHIIGNFFKLPAFRQFNMTDVPRWEELREENDTEHERLTEELRKKSQELIFLINVKESDKLIQLLNYILDIHQLTDFVSNYFVIKFSKRYKIFNELDMEKRGTELLLILDELIENFKKKRENIIDEKKDSRK